MSARQRRPQASEATRQMTSRLTPTSPSDDDVVVGAHRGEGKRHAQASAGDGMLEPPRRRRRPGGVSRAPPSKIVVILVFNSPSHSWSKGLCNRHHPHIREKPNSILVARQKSSVDDIVRATGNGVYALGIAVCRLWEFIYPHAVQEQIDVGNEDTCALG